MNTIRSHIIIRCFILFYFAAAHGAFGQQAGLKVQLGHNKAIASVDISQNGQLAVTGGMDNAVKLWNLESGRLLRGYYRHRHFVKSVAFHPSSGIFASGSWDKTIKLYRTDEKSPYLNIKGHEGGIESIAFKGKVIASASLDGTVRLWNINNGEQLEQYNCGKPVHALAFQKHGSMLAAGLNDGSIQLWDVSKGEKMQTWKEHAAKIRGLAFQPSGKLLAGISDDKSVKIWHTEKNTSIKTLRDIGEGANTTGGFNDLAFSNDGRQVIVSSSAGAIISWSVPDGERINRTNTRQFATGALALPQGADYAWVAAGKDLIRWELATGTQAGKIVADAVIVRALAMDDKGKRLAFGTGKGMVRILDFSTGRILSSFYTSDDPIEALQFVPGSNQLMAGNRAGTIYFYDTGKGKIVKKYADEDGTLSAAHFRIDGKYFASGGFNSTVKFRDARNGKLMREFNGHDDKVMDVALSRNGKWLASAGWDGYLNVWDVHGNALKQSFKVADAELWSVLFHPDNQKLYTGGEHGELTLWQLQTNKKVRQWKAHDDIVECLALSPDKQTLASGSWDKSIRLWDASTGKLKAELKGHQNYVKSLVFSPDGQYLLSGAADGQIKIWDMETHKPVLSYVPANDKEHFVVAHPQGYFDGTNAGVNARLHYVRDNKTIPLAAFSEKFRYPNLWGLCMKGNFRQEKGRNKPIAAPPEVELQVVADALTRKGYNHYTTDEQSIELKVVAREHAYDVEELRLYHNGKLVKTGTRGFKQIEEERKTYSRVFQVNLLKGSNTLYAAAVDANRTEAESARVEIERSGISAKPTLYMLVIGINAYKNSSLNLNYARADADAFISRTKAGAKGIFDDVKVRSLAGKKFVKKNFMEQMNAIAEEAKAEDVFVFYYAGHGTVAGTGKDEDFYLVPYDITQLYGNDTVLQNRAVSTQMLTDLTAGIPARKQLLLLDACHSGQAVNAFTMRGAAEQKALVQLARSSGVTMIASSGTEQYASEIRALGHGVFTYALLEALKGRADGGVNDKKITTTEIRAYLEDRVPELTETHKGQAQYPVSFSRGRDFPLVIKP